MPSILSAATMATPHTAVLLHLGTIDTTYTMPHNITHNKIATKGSTWWTNIITNGDYNDRRQYCTPTIVKMIWYWYRSVHCDIFKCYRLIIWKKIAFTRLNMLGPSKENTFHVIVPFSKCAYKKHEDNNSIQYATFRFSGPLGICDHFTNLCIATRMYLQICEIHMGL